MRSYTPIKKGVRTERHGCLSSQRPQVHTEGSGAAPAEDSEAVTATLSIALKSLLRYRKKNTWALNMAPECQGAGGKYEEEVNTDVDGDILARGLDEFDSEYRADFLKTLSYAIDILNIAIYQLRTAEPGGRVEQHLSKVFAVEEEGLNDILDFSAMAKLLEENYSILRDALIDFGGGHRNQISITDSMDHIASIHPNDPSRRLSLGLGFFEAATYLRAQALIHEVSHQELDTEDYWYNAAFKPTELSSHYYRKLEYLERSIDLQRKVVIGLSVEYIEDKAKFAMGLGMDSSDEDTDCQKAINLFHNDFVERLDAYINNADSVACLAPIIAGPDLVTLSNRGIYKK